ncbi:TatD family hydrolase [Candidatus Woesearchaeota archaeon]|nr:TatD family hydrolase [Candidatus Woesearchaeota archaeon]
MTLNLVDVHCHLMHEQFEKDLPEVITRAEKAGVKIMLVSGTTPEANIAALELAKKYPQIKASLGIYPIDALGLQPDVDGMPHHVGPIDIKEQFQFIKKNIKDVTAIGEIGMDFYWAKKEETYERQAENFRKIIRFAKEIKKPIVIHSRKAEEECIAILEQELHNKEIPVVQHCFSGRKSLMSKAIELGHFFSIPPNILRADNFKTLVKKAPIEQLLTETDAPWLSPFSGKRNEPSFVLETIKMIAEIKELSVEETAVKIWENYKRVFNGQ